MELTQSLGLDPDPIMRTVGIDPATLATPDAWLAAQALDELLERTALATSCENFGVRMAEGRRVSNLGAVGLVAREEPDVRSALAMVLRHMRLHNEAIRTRLVEFNGLASLQFEPETGMTLGRQSIELTVAAISRMLGTFLPDDWSPLSTCFVHDAPTTLDVHHRVLGSDVAFDRDFNGLVLYSSDLDSTNPLSDPLFRPYARQYLDLLVPREDSSVDSRVRDMVEALLPGGRCTATRIARSLEMDRRTLHRHLSRSGESYSSIVDSVRADLARRYITRGDRSLTDIAGKLGFSDLSSFSRWFRREFGLSPTAWAAQEGELGLR
ncbi:AraC family transcriptional regulator [Saccharopolyspora shandongensis]|uniref:AraC family transcriptional regulator n=1 Tax=Saccharopolyspora shandongensis TaxID=418495 RepID=UPI00340841D0